jgi:hypothetical protein
VSKERGEQLALEYGIKFIETSAKFAVNVEQAFFTLARDIKVKVEKKLVRAICLYLVVNRFNSIANRLLFLFVRFPGDGILYIEGKSKNMYLCSTA